MAEATTWAEQLDAPLEIRPVAEGRRGMQPGQLMLYPNGRSVDDAIRAIPRGQSMSLKSLRDELAQQHGAEIVCPVTTRRSLRTVAEAAYEAFASGTPIGEVTPFWRVLEPEAPLLKRLSFDPAFVIEQRTREAL